MENKLNKKMMVIKGKDAMEAHIDEMLDECEKSGAEFTLNVVNLFSTLFSMNEEKEIEEIENMCLDFMAGMMSALSTDLCNHLHQVSSEYRKLRETDIDLEKLYDALRKAGEDND